MHAGHTIRLIRIINLSQTLVSYLVTCEVRSEFLRIIKTSNSEVVSKPRCYNRYFSYLNTHLLTWQSNFTGHSSCLCYYCPNDFKERKYFIITNQNVERVLAFEHVYDDFLFPTYWLGGNAIFLCNVWPVSKLKRNFIDLLSGSKSLQPPSMHSMVFVVLCQKLYFPRLTKTNQVFTLPVLCAGCESVFRLKSTMLNEFRWLWFLLLQFQPARKTGSLLLVFGCGLAHDCNSSSHKV